MTTALETNQNFHQKIVAQFLGDDGRAVDRIKAIASRFGISTLTVTKILITNRISIPIEGGEIDMDVTQISNLKSDLQNYMRRNLLTSRSLACQAGGTLTTERINGVIYGEYMPSHDEKMRLQKVLIYASKARAG